jgi:hypothetical protein
VLNRHLVEEHSKDALLHLSFGGVSFVYRKSVKCRKQSS